MDLNSLKSKIPDYAKDIKLNLDSLLNNNDADGMRAKQIAGVALASAYAAREKHTIQACLAYAEALLQAEDINGIKAAASIMGMTNIYYRFTHEMKDEDYSHMPAKLRMNIMGKPGIDKIDFDFYTLAASSINGCAMCMNAHANALQKHGVSKEAIQTCIRVASVIHALSQVMVIEDF